MVTAFFQVEGIGFLTAACSTALRDMMKETTVMEVFWPSFFFFFFFFSFS